jgi:uncharacterized membrane protein
MVRIGVGNQTKCSLQANGISPVLWPPSWIHQFRLLPTTLAVFMISLAKLSDIENIGKATRISTINEREAEMHEPIVKNRLLSGSPVVT